MNQNDVVTRLRTGLEHVKEELHQAETALKTAGDGLAQRVRPAVERLERTRDAAAALHRLEEEAAETRDALAADLEREYHQLEAELRILRSELRSELAENVDAYRSAANEQLLAWRAGLDELRVQAHLAKMDARDELTILLDRVESRYHEATRQLRASASDSDLAPLRESLRGVFHDLRSAADHVTETLRSQRRS